MHTLIVTRRHPPEHFAMYAALLQIGFLLAAWLLVFASSYGWIATADSELVLGAYLNPLGVFHAPLWLNFLLIYPFYVGVSFAIGAILEAVYDTLR